MAFFSGVWVLGELIAIGMNKRVEHFNHGNIIKIEMLRAINDFLLKQKSKVQLMHGWRTEYRRWKWSRPRIVGWETKNRLIDIGMVNLQHGKIEVFLLC